MPADGPPDPEPMRDTTSEAPTETAARRRAGRAVRLIAAGLLVAAGIAAAGRGLVAWRLGDDAAIRAGLESDARRHVAHLITDLQRMAATLARRPEVRAGLRDELESPRRLFAAIDTLLDPAADGPALTIYGATGQAARVGRAAVGAAARSRARRRQPVRRPCRARSPARGRRAHQRIGDERAPPRDGGGGSASIGAGRQPPGRDLRRRHRPTAR